MNSLVSVIIPVYNVEAYLEDAVRSIGEQTYENLEIVLVIDGSTDNSGILCNQLALIDNRIKVIHKINGGLSSARNIGLDNVKGDYVLFIDSDDFIERDAVKTLLYAFKKYENIGIVSAPCFYSYANGEKCIYNEVWNIDKERIIGYNDFCLSTLKQTSCHSACCKLYKKDLLDNIRFREGKKNEDTLFMFDLSSIMCKMKLNMLEIVDKFYYYRVTEGSITRNDSKPIEVDIIENILDLIKEASNPEIVQTLKRLFYGQIINFYYLLETDRCFQQNIHPQYLKKAKRAFNEIKSQELIKYTSFKIFIKFYLLKNVKPVYIMLRNIINLIKSKKR